MTRQSLLDIQSDRPDDALTSPAEKPVIMPELITNVEIIKSNYVTKAELAATNGKMDTLSAKLDALALTLNHQTDVFKAELAAFKAQMELTVKIQMEAAFQAHTAETFKRFSTKQELSDAVYQLTWRMAGFGAVLLSAGFAFARFV